MVSTDCLPETLPTNISKMSVSSGCDDEKADDYRCFEDYKCTATEGEGRSVAVKRTLRQMSPSGTVLKGSSAKRMRLSVTPGDPAPVETCKTTKAVPPDLGMLIVELFMFCRFARLRLDN